MAMTQGAATPRMAAFSESLPPYLLTPLFVSGREFWALSKSRGRLSQNCVCFRENAGGTFRSSFITKMQDFLQKEILFHVCNMAGA
jgi:hypothetical protein